MKTINKKLISESGATILFAMMVFLVASVVSMVIIIAATTSVKRESSFKDSVGRNIELDSCAIMFKNKFDNKEYTFTINDVRYEYLDTITDEFERIMIDISDKILNNTFNSDWNDCFVLTGENLTNLNGSYKIFKRGSSSFLVSFKFDNGSIMYSNYNVEIDSHNSSQIKWSFDKTTNKEVKDK